MIKKVLFILMPEDFQELEFEVPYKALCEQGFVVDVAGLQPGEARGKSGAMVKPNLILTQMKDADLDTYHALVIPGGPGSTTYLWGNKLIQKIAWDFNNKKKIIAAICHACAVFAEAGLLTGKKATIYPSKEALALFAEHKVKYVDQPCVVIEEEKIITAQGPKAAKEFAEAIISLLKE